MKKKLMTLVGALSLVACGSGTPWEGGPEKSDRGDLRPGWPETWVAGSGGFEPGDPGVAGSNAGGNESAGTGSGGTESAGTASGGYESGGTGSGGGEAGGTDSGGYESGGTGYGGYESGGTGYGGGASGGNGSQEQGCMLNVARCFDAAANCYEYSPWSDCDQIVDVCAAMQLACND